MPDYSIEYNKVVEYLLARGNFMIVSGREFSYEYDDETAYHIIRIPPKSRNTLSGILGLLHEAGHANSPPSPFKLQDTDPILILEREFTAWESGRKLLRKLKLHSLDPAYCKEWAKCWSTYVTKLSKLYLD